MEGNGLQSGVYESVHDALPNAVEVLEELRRNIGKKGFAALHEVVDLTKAGIEAVYREDDVTVDRIDSKVGELYEQFLYGRLPERMASHLPGEFDDETPAFSKMGFLHDMAQEMVEFRFVAKIWPVISGRTEIVPALPSPKDCNVPLQSWLKGILDVISECAKLMGRKLENPELTLDERIAWHARYLAVARQLTQRMRELSHSPGGVINNTTRRFQGFHQALGGVSRMIGGISVTYVSLLNSKAANDDLINRLKKIEIGV